MARVTYGSIITDIQGSIGAHTFQHNGTGKVVHLRQCPRPRLTVKQSISHSDFTYFSQLWKTLSVRQQAVWSQFALSHNYFNNFNKELTISGFNWYMSINSLLSRVGSSPLITPPVYSAPEILADGYIMIDGKGVFFIFDTPVTLTGETLCIYTTSPVNFNSQKIQGSYRFTKLVTSSPVSVVDITSSFESTHGFDFDDLILNAKFNLFCYAFKINNSTGLKSSSIFSSDDISNYSYGIGSDIIEKNLFVY